MVNVMLPRKIIVTPELGYEIDIMNEVLNVYIINYIL